MNSNKKKVVIISVVSSLIIFISAVIVLLLSLDVNSEYTVSYSNSSKLDYKVYLKPNSYFIEKYLPKGKQYVPSLIDNVDVNFKYNFVSNEDADLEYSYYIIGTVLVDNLKGKNIFKQEQTLLAKKSYTDVENKTFKINENLKIDYGKFNNLAMRFINDYGISATAKLEVKLYVDVIGKKEKFDESLKEAAVATLEIPLTDKGTDVTFNAIESNNTNEVRVDKEISIDNMPLFITSIILVIIGVTVIIVTIVLKNMSLTKEELYQSKLKRILRDYERYITETSGNVNIEKILKSKNLMIERVKSFDNLINVRDSVEKPILYHEDVPGETAVFYIVDDKTAFVYIMSIKDM